MTEGTAPETKPLTTLQKVIKVFERVMLAHLAAYPIAFLWGLGVSPILIHRSFDEFSAIEGNEAATTALMTHKLILPLAVSFTLVHLLAIPWAFGKDPIVGRRFFLRTAGAVTLLGVLVGGAAWIWLFTL